MRKSLNRLGRILTKNPINHFLRAQHFNLKHRYKSACKKEKRKFKRKLQQNLEHLYRGGSRINFRVLQNLQKK